MQLGIGPHLDEAELEQYSMGTLPEARLAPFEEHLLACNSCQDHLLEMEAYVNAVRSVSPKLRKAPAWREVVVWPRLAWVVAGGLCLLAVTLGRLWITAQPRSTEVAAVLLHSSRGIEGLTAAQAPAGKPLALNIDLTELPAFPSYRLEIVNSMGKQVWETSAAAHEAKISQRFAKGLSAGQYYARLYGPGGELLREYGLRIQ
jgi:hypothetical protein